MNASPGPDLSIYQLALEVQMPSQVLSLTPATLLSLLKSQIDLLIEQQIAATLWVKLPPGKIWHSEIQRYRQQFGEHGVIYTCQVAEKGRDVETRYGASGGVEGENTSSSQKCLELLSNSQIRREYFFIVLSPRFCSLIVVYRQLKSPKTLLTITTVDGKVIQQVLDGMKKITITELSAIAAPADLICPSVEMLHATSLLSQLLAKQLQRQDEINRQIITKRIAKVEQQKQILHNSLQLKDEFLSNVCQELRTPLTHMKTALSLLNSPSLKNPQRQRYLQMLKRECDRQNSLIHGVLELVQIEHNLEETNLESVRLADIVPGVVSTYQPLAQEKGIMLAYTVPTELPAVWCVIGGLRQLVIHLLSNSIKYTPNGGQVWVRGRLQGDYVLLELRDTGIGIAESEIPKIFDRFYRVRPLPTEDPGGAGLGLTIVQQLLRNCGGSISVKSKLSEGSTFTVQLAIASDKPHEN
ncbi:DICT sensory domain-containing protein [Fischerella sp. PCC 9605]|uniref:DICT sensory domain-containing protein n=1 Tax=Fischerella sp. PCC 9605 TaxID=1173024 RepID=UPI00047D2533|nr:DICT sensory domain-containing protein [Fischerella sp. PCC 9605]